MAQWIALSLPTKKPRVRFSAFPGIILLMLLRFTDILQKLDSAHQTHLGLASGKLALK